MGTGMGECMRALMTVVLLLGLCCGCCRKAEKPCGKSCVPPPRDTPEATESSEGIAPEPPAPKSASTKPGMAKARQYQLEVLERRLPELGKRLNEAAEACMKVEVEQRKGDPELGRLYNELINAQKAYREAMDANPAYVEANATKNDLFDEYKSLTERRDVLLKESGE